MRTINECALGHQFTTSRCPVCEPDELAILRAEKKYRDEREIYLLMSDGRDNVAATQDEPGVAAIAVA